MYTLNEHEFDEFLQIAEMVTRLNPYMRGDNPHKVVQYMLDTANSTLANKASYVAIQGWMVTSYKIDGEYRLKPSLHSCLYREVMAAIKD